MAMQGKLYLASYILFQVLLANALEQSCSNTQTVFSTIIIEGTSSPDGGIYSSLTPRDDPEANSACQLDSTCCSLEAENMFQSNIDTKMQFAEILTSHLGSCRNPSIFNATANYMLINKKVIRQDFELGQYIGSIGSDFHIIDNFWNYLASTIHTGNLEQLRDKYIEMIFELFLIVYFDASDYRPETHEVRQCFYDYFHEQQQSQLDESVESLKKAMDSVMRYLRALRVGDRIIDSMLGYRLTVQCEQSLMKMKYCANCAGYSSSLQSCDGLCMNTIRGCFVDLLDLVEPIEAYSEALAAMRDRIIRIDPFNAITFINIDIIRTFSLLTSSQDQIVTNINARCVNQNRKKRDARLVRAKRAPIVLVENPPPLDEVRAASQCLLNNLEAFNSTTDALCQHEGTDAIDDECWNGQVFGSYERNVLPYNRVEQQDNPEMVVCQNSQFSRDISLLRYITKELTSITSRCSRDDEDCIEVQDTNRYYDFDSIDLSLVSNEEMSGSGSGDSNDEMCQRQEIETTAVPVQTTPTEIKLPTETKLPIETTNTTATASLVTVDIQNGSNKLSSGFALTVLLLATASS